MHTNDFKTILNEVAGKHGFYKAHSGWFKDSHECIAVLGLQKSDYSNSYYLNIKIFIQGMFGNTYVQNKDLVKKEIGNLFTRPPKEFKDVFDLDNEISKEIRIEKLYNVFENYIVPFTNKALTKAGIIELYKEGFNLSPGVKNELGLN